MAWAPPMRYTSSTPATAAAASTGGAMRPSGPGGEHMANPVTPATRAGAAVISTVEASGARPPGTYRPARSTGTRNVTDQHAVALITAIGV